MLNILVLVVPSGVTQNLTKITMFSFFKSCVSFEIKLFIGIATHLKQELNITPE